MALCQSAASTGRLWCRLSNSCGQALLAAMNEVTAVLQVPQPKAREESKADIHDRENTSAPRPPRSLETGQPKSRKTRCHSSRRTRKKLRHLWNVADHRPPHLPPPKTDGRYVAVYSGFRRREETRAHRLRSFSENRRPEHPAESSYRESRLSSIDREERPPGLRRD